MGRPNMEGRERRIVGQAIAILERQMKESRARYEVGSPHRAREYLRLRLGMLEHEVFVVVFLDAQNRVLGAEELFQGSLTETVVYKREVVKAALRYNAAAIIIAHNHPSGSSEFSQDDEVLRMGLIRALEPVDIKVLDSLLVAGSEIASWAEHQALADDAERVDDLRAARERQARQSAAAKAAWARRKAAAGHG